MPMQSSPGMISSITKTSAPCRLIRSSALSPSETAVTSISFVRAAKLLNLLQYSLLSSAIITFIFYIIFILRFI